MDMRTMVAALVTFLAGGLVGGSRADADVAGAVPRGPATGTVVVPLVGAGGRPVFCAANHSGALARPQGEGGYRVTLPPGRHVVHLEVTDERIDVLVTVAAGDEVVVPPVVVRGTCREVAVAAPVTDEPDESGWALRIGRRYQARTGLSPAAFERDRDRMQAAARRAPSRHGRTRDL